MKAMSPGKWKMWIAAVVATLISSSPVSAFEDLLPPMNGQASDFAVRRAGADVSASIQIGVTNQAVYCISQTGLVAIGVSPSSLIGSQLRLYSRSQEVAIAVSSSGAWTNGDYLLFYGKGFDGACSKTNIYWLGFGGTGLRMAGRAVPLRGGAPTVLSTPRTVQYNRRYWFWETYRPADDWFDHWFADSLANGTNTNTTLPTDNCNTSQPASFVGLFFGYSSTTGIVPDHNTRVKIGGNTVGNFTYDSQDACTGACSFSGSFIGTSTVVSLTQILQPGCLVDQAWLQSLSVTYWRYLKAQGNALLFQGLSGTNNYLVNGFSGATNFWLMDVTVDTAPVLLTGFVATNGTGGSGLWFGDIRTGVVSYAMCNTSGWKTVSWMQRVQFRGLADTNRQADYIVICPYGFRQQAYRLLRYRYKQGLSVAVAPLPDIYNEFGYGVADPEAIKQFLGYAFHYWSAPAPRYVVLLGNGSYDPEGVYRGRSVSDSYSAPDIVPVHMGPSIYKWTALDGWYVQINGSDNVPDLALGRIPVVNETFLSNALDKVIGLEAVATNDFRRTEALLVADKIDNGLDFQAACETVRTNYLGPAGISTTTAYNDDMTVALTRQTINATVNGGVMFSYYFGHGSMDQWGAYDIYNTNDVYALVNTFYPVMSMLTCENGAFQSPTDKKCMVEALLERAGHGGTACIASTALTEQPSCEAFAAGYSTAIFSNRTRRLGDAILAGYVQLYSMNPTTQELLFIELFGDPATIINAP